MAGKSEEDGVVREHPVHLGPQVERAGWIDLRSRGWGDDSVIGSGASHELIQRDDSLVVLCLRQNRLDLLARVDVPHPDPSAHDDHENMDALVAALMPAIRRDAGIAVPLGLRWA